MPLTFCRNNIDKSHWSLLQKPLYQLYWRLANVWSHVSHKKCLILSTGSTQASNHWLRYGGTKSRYRNEFGNTGLQWAAPLIHSGTGTSFLHQFCCRGHKKSVNQAVLVTTFFIFVQILPSPWDFGNSSTGGTISFPVFCHFQPKLTVWEQGKERCVCFWSCPAWGVWRKGASLPLAASLCVT